LPGGTSRLGQFELQRRCCGIVAQLLHNRQVALLQLLLDGAFTAGMCGSPFATALLLCACFFVHAASARAHYVQATLCSVLFTLCCSCSRATICNTDTLRSASCDMHWHLPCSINCL
jgi:hypothetical protein